jgi:hypothetical protein
LEEFRLDPAATLSTPGKTKSLALSFVHHAAALLNLQREQQQLLQTQQQKLLLPGPRGLAGAFQTNSQEERDVEFEIAQLSHVTYGDLYLSEEDIFSERKMLLMLNRLLSLSQVPLTSRIYIPRRSRLCLVSTVVGSLNQFLSKAPIANVYRVSHALKTGHEKLCFDKLCLQIKIKVRQLARMATRNHLFYVFFKQYFEVEMTKWY